MHPGTDDDVAIGELKPTLTVLQVVGPLAFVDAAVFIPELADSMAQALLPVSIVL